MSILAVCMVLAVAAQGWDNPSIQEAELAPPAGISESPAVGQAAPAPVEEPAPSRDVESAPRAEESQAEPPRELQWEYDDEGKPVALPSDEPKEAAPKGRAPAEKPRQKQEKPRPASSGGRHVATFWFVLPK